MATTVQILNYTPENHKLELSSGSVHLPPALRTGVVGTAFASQAQSVDLALLTGNGRRELKRLLSSGSIIVLSSGSLS